MAIPQWREVRGWKKHRNSWINWDGLVVRFVATHFCCSHIWKKNIYIYCIYIYIYLNRLYTYPPNMFTQMSYIHDLLGWSGGMWKSSGGPVIHRPDHPMVGMSGPTLPMLFSKVHLARQHRHRNSNAWHSPSATGTVGLPEHQWPTTEQREEGTTTPATTKWEKQRHQQQQQYTCVGVVFVPVLCLCLSYCLCCVVLLVVNG